MSDHELVLEVESDKFDPDDDRWAEQVAQLYDELHKGAGPVRQEYTPQEGTKGALATVIIALGSAGAFTAAVEIFKAWLGRDKTRRIRVKTKDFEGEWDLHNVSDKMATEIFDRTLPKE